MHDAVEIVIWFEFLNAVKAMQHSALLNVSPLVRASKQKRYRANAVENSNHVTKGMHCDHSCNSAEC